MKKRIKDQHGYTLTTCHSSDWIGRGSILWIRGRAYEVINIKGSQTAITVKKLHWFESFILKLALYFKQFFKAGRL